MSRGNPRATGDPFTFVAVLSLVGIVALGLGPGIPPVEV